MRSYSLLSYKYRAYAKHTVRTLTVGAKNLSPETEVRYQALNRRLTVGAKNLSPETADRYKA